MKSNELMIGNWVHCEYNKCNTAISAVELYMMANDARKYSPIPMTHEILQMAGFERLRDGYSKVVEKIIAYEDTSLPCSLQYQDGTTHMCICRGGIYSIAPDVKYVHQLQNLYYALTQTSLTITL